MSNIRLFIKDEIHYAKLFKLSIQHTHYLKDVMRAKLNQSIIVFNGKDGEWEATIKQINKNYITIQAIQNTKQQPILAKELCLCFALVKWNILRNVIRQATELGINVLQPVLTDYTIVRNINITKLEMCAIEAAEQCRRLTIPKILNVVNFHEICEKYHNNLVICNENDRTNTPELALPKINNPILLIGPEGGFSKDELSYQGLSHMSLGNEILKVDTAVVCALTYLKAFAQN